MYIASFKNKRSGSTSEAIAAKTADKNPGALRQLEWDAGKTKTNFVCCEHRPTR